MFKLSHVIKLSGVMFLVFLVITLFVCITDAMFGPRWWSPETIELLATIIVGCEATFLFAGLIWCMEGEKEWKTK